ncbi:MAG: alpha-1,3-mannosyltransferase family protein [Elainella sp. Prado103]|nr:alpha-1,3-mannosyltransferase family protein [Elainella sp. Prado103]
MKRGIYITANDRVTEQTIALIKSIRFYDPETPVVMIPYNDQYHQIAEVLKPYGVTVFADLEFIDRLTAQLQQTFGNGFFARPNVVRKFACWFGEFDRFLYIDTDVVVFEKIADHLNELETYDFICCDYQHTTGLTNVFTPAVIESGVLSATDCQDVFNSGFWGSKKGVISEADLGEIFAECAAHPEYFDFSQKTSDQPILNYTVLSRFPKRLNLVRRSEKAPGNWAGSQHFWQSGDRLIDPKVNQPLQYLHWAGIRIEPGCPYWEIWAHYRYLNEAKPSMQPVPASPKPQFWQRALRKLSLK